MARSKAPANAPGLTTFSYTAVSPTGTRVKAKMQAPDADAVSAALAAEGWVPLKVTEVSGGGLNLDVGEMIGRGGVRMKVADLAAFARQMHQLLRAGVPVPKTVAALGEEADPKITQMCVEISERVSAGTPLSEAFAEYPSVFDDVFCAYIAAGEEAGTLVQATGRLATLLEREASMRNKVKSATAYPKIASMAIALIVVGVIMFLVPTFGRIYANLGAELPLPTRALVSFSGIVNPLHAQVGPVQSVYVPVKGEEEPKLFNITENSIKLDWQEVQNAWDPLTAPLPTGSTGQNLIDPTTGKDVQNNPAEEGGGRKMNKAGEGVLLIYEGSKLVAQTEYKDRREGWLNSGVVVAAVCKGKVITPSPGSQSTWTPCPAGDGAQARGLTQRVKDAFGPPSVRWLSPATWLEALRQPDRSILTSPINFLSPTLWILVALYLVRRWLKKRKDDLDIGEKVDRIRFSLPIFGQLNKRIALFRWSSTLGGSLEAGVQTYRSLDLAGRASGSRWIQKATLELQENVRTGRPVSAGLSDFPDLFPPNLRALVSTGESTGELDTMLDSVATTLDEEISAIISGLAAKIEVALILVMGVVVGAIVVILYLPIFGLAGAAGDGLGKPRFLPPQYTPPWQGGG